MRFQVIESGRYTNDNQALGSVSIAQPRDEVGEMMRALCAQVMAGPIPAHLREFVLNSIPVGNYDNSTMRG